jgi:hypothetical protein
MPGDQQFILLRRLDIRNSSMPVRVFFLIPGGERPGYVERRQHRADA